VSSSETTGNIKEVAPEGKVTLAVVKI